MCAMKLITLWRLLCYDQVRCMLDYILSHLHLSVHITMIFITYIYNIKIKRWWIKGCRWNLFVFPNEREVSTSSIGSKEFSVFVCSRFSLCPACCFCWSSSLIVGEINTVLQELHSFYYYRVLSLVQGSTQLSRRIAVIYWETSDSKLQALVIS